MAALRRYNFKIIAEVMINGLHNNIFTFPTC